MRFLILLILLTCPGLFAQQAEPLLFNEMIHSFGIIDEDGGSADFEFIFTNNSGLTVSISSVKASCGCTTPGWTKEPIPPGKTGFIKASFNPKGRPGYFNKTLTVNTNLSGPPIVLQIKGTVSHKEGEEDNTRLAYRLGRLQFRSRTINFGKVYINKPSVGQDFIVFNSGDKAVNITEVKVPPYIKVLAPPSVEAGTRGNIRIEYNALLKNQYGFTGDNIELVTDDDLMPQKAFTVYATVEEFFPPLSPGEEGTTPALTLGSETVDFGSVAVGRSVKKEVSLRNSGRKDLVIRFIQPNCPCVLTSLDGERIKAGDTRNLTITWTGEGRRGTQNKAVTIYSSDPLNPVQRISLSGQIN